MGTAKNFLAAAELTDLLLEHRQYIMADDDIGENRTGPEIIRAINRIPKRHLRHVSILIRENPEAGETLDIVIGNSAKR
ncbi:MAG: hypothetical protein NVSMB39_7010 [Candidatus Saccharimonadales bacterium]